VNNDSSCASQSRERNPWRSCPAKPKPRRPSDPIRREKPHKQIFIAYLTHMKQRRTNPLFFLRETFLSPASGNNHLFPDSCDTRIRNKAPGSTLRAARGSLRNRCPDRRRCAIPPECSCTPMIQQMRFGRVCAGSGGCADTGSHGETGNYECDGLDGH
jgi:hypothetical protein